MYTGIEGLNRKASDYDEKHKDDPRVLTRDKVPSVVNFPRQIWVRPTSTKEPFAPSSDPYINKSEDVTLSLLFIAPPVSVYNEATLTQLRVSGPLVHLFYSKGQPQDDGTLGAPWSFDTTYLLLTLSVADNSIPPFRVLFRSRISQGPNLEYTQLVIPKSPSFSASVSLTNLLRFPLFTDRLKLLPEIQHIQMFKHLCAIVTFKDLSWFASSLSKLTISRFATARDCRNRRGQIRTSRSPSGSCSSYISSRSVYSINRVCRLKCQARFSVE